ncbi:MAG: phytoene desaturase family protein [Roseiflexaceae bacterium]
MAKHVIIVGAGPGGLASAMRLAAAGYQVSIYEASDRVGGRMAGFTRGEYAFDTGPTILQVPHVYEDLFRDCGLHFRDYVRLLRVDPNTRLKFWDGTHLDLMSDRAAFKQQLGNFQGDAPAAFDRWYAEHIRKNVVGYGPYLGTPVRPVLKYLNPREIAAALPFRPWESLFDHFQGFFQDERLAYGLGYQAKYLGMHPTECSSVFSLVTWLEFEYGIWHPEGGFRALAQALAKAATDLGVTIHLKRPVRQVIVEGKHAKGVELSDGERIMADAVLVNADFAHALTSIVPPEARGKYTEQKLQRMQFSCSTFMLYLSVDRRWDDLPHHQLYLSDHIRRREKPYVDDSALDEIDPPFYVCNPTPLDPSNAPAGHSTLFVLVPIPNTMHGIDWKAKQQSFRDLIVSRLPMLGYEGVADHIVDEACYTAETWRDDYRVYQGAVFNLVHSWTQLGPLRPHIRSQAARGLYYVGGAVHPGSGLLTILEAAKSAAFFIGQDLPTAKQPALVPA